MSTDERFMAFHKANPHVYNRLVDMALGWIGAGRKHGGIKMFWEALRYEGGLKTDGSEYKLNNNYPSYYARLIMQNVPALAGFFSLREAGGGESKPEDKFYSE